MFCLRLGASSALVGRAVLAERWVGNQRFDDERNGMRLAGAGIRSKFGVVNVYAVGLYVHPSFRGDLRGVDTELRFALLRDLDNKAFVAAIEKQLAARVDDRDQVARFVATCLAHLPQLMPSTFATALHLDPTGNIDLAVGDDVVASLFAPDVADALLDVYVGDNAVSKHARDSILAGLAHDFLQPATTE